MYNEITIFNSLKSVFLQVLNKHVTGKKDILRANNVPYMTKALRKAIIERS